LDDGYLLKAASARVIKSKGVYRQSHLTNGMPFSHDLQTGF